MKTGRTATGLLGAALLLAQPSSAQAPREDVIWARSTNGAPITLDGVLDEPAWAAAESKVVRYRVDNGLPGSGWKDEVPSPITADSTYAVIKLLTVGHQLYMGAFVRDSSVGGGGDFNRFDGFLMSLKDHESLGRPAPTMEYLYSWWAQTLPPGPGPVDGSPYFGGRWATPPWGSPRTQEQIDAWDAVTRVHGISNSDAAPDTGYTVEMRFDLQVMGYDITQPGGDIVEWNISIYDCDWRWPGALPARISANRTWWEDPWGNVSWYGQVEIHARPDVTVASGAVPAVGPRTIIPSAGGWPAPTIDGSLSEEVWSYAPTLEIRYGDDALRDGYGPIAKWRSGQYQPMVNGGQAGVLDPANATVRWFFKDDTVYFGFDVLDQVVQYAPNFNTDRWDGFTLTVNERGTSNADHVNIPRGLSLIVGPTGQALPQDYLPYLRDSLQGAKVALVLKPGTTVDTVGTSPDVGYSAELAIVLTRLGYPAGRGDGSFFFGVDHHDGDSFTPFTFSYGTRTWWYRERPGTCCPTWAYLDPATVVVGVADRARPAVPGVALLGTHPNPFDGVTWVRFRLAATGVVTLDVFDLQGRRVAGRDLGVRGPGTQQAAFHGSGMRPGLYLYRLTVTDAESGSRRATPSGRMILIR